jgi:hypothetical protein
MNSTLLLIVILGLPLAAAPPAQDPDMTCGQENGRAWHDMDSPTKVGFILGLRATMAHLAIRGVVDLEQRHRYLVDQLTFGETARAVDRFYETPENMPIPILWAMEVIANRGGGADATTIERMTAFFRTRPTACAQPVDEPPTQTAGPVHAPDDEQPGRTDSLF